MKKIILIAVCIILTVQYSFSQNSIGIKAGMNIANTAFGYSGYKPRIGWYAGGTANISIDHKYFIQPELLYNIKGSRYDYFFSNLIDAPNNSYRETGSLSLNYLSLPLLFGYKPFSKLSIVGGPEFGYLTSIRSNNSMNVNYIIDKGYYEVLKDSKKFDFGADIGMMYRVTPSMCLDVRYNHGFNTLNERIIRPNQNDSNNPYVTNKSGGNRVIQIGASYYFKD